MTPSTRIGAVAVAVVAAVIYSGWLLESVLDNGIDPMISFVSELGARSEPHGTFFARLDTIAGTLFVVLAAALRRCGTWLVPAGFAVWGLATVADSIFRMPMVTTTGVAGALTDAEKAAVTAHAVCSSIAAVGMALVGLGLWLLARQRGWGVRSAWLRWLAGAFLISLAAVAVTSGLYEFGGPNLWLGAWQRISLVLAAVVMVILAVGVARSAGVAGTTGAAGTAGTTGAAGTARTGS